MVINPLTQVPGIGDVLASDTPLTERPWFWISIGLLVAFMGVLLILAWRGWRQWKRVKLLYAEVSGGGAWVWGEKRARRGLGGGAGEATWQ